jgi:hypothetical protein
MAGTAHEAFLEAYFSPSDIRPFDDAMEAREALQDRRSRRHVRRRRAPHVLAGEPRLARLLRVRRRRLSRSALLQPAAGDRGEARRHGLRQVLDYGLDRVQTSGDFARAYRLFFPMPPW